MISSLHVLLDIEALGRRPGCAIIELGAVAFDLTTGKLGEVFHRHTLPHPALHADLETLEWHRQHGTFPKSSAVIGDRLSDVLDAFNGWICDLGDVQAFWSWGSTYDFPILDAAYTAVGAAVPWRYHQCQCARTVWNLAFPGRRHALRPHSALQDSIDAAGDLREALAALKA